MSHSQNALHHKIFPFQILLCIVMCNAVYGCPERPDCLEPTWAYIAMWENANSDKGRHEWHWSKVILGLFSIIFYIFLCSDMFSKTVKTFHCTITRRYIDIYGSTCDMHNSVAHGTGSGVESQPVSWLKCDWRTAGNGCEPGHVISHWIQPKRWSAGAKPRILIANTQDWAQTAAPLRENRGEQHLIIVGTAKWQLDCHWC